MQVATCSDIPRSCGQSLQRLGVIRDRCTLLELVLESSAQYANIHANGKVRSCARARTSSAVSRRHSRRGNMTSRHAKSQVQATVQQASVWRSKRHQPKCLGRDTCRAMYQQCPEIPHRWRLVVHNSVTQTVHSIVLFIRAKLTVNLSSKAFFAVSIATKANSLRQQ